MRALSKTIVFVAMVALTSRLLGQLPVALANMLTVTGAFILAFLCLPGGRAGSHSSHNIRSVARVAIVVIPFSLLYLITPPNVYFVRIFLVSLLCILLGEFVDHDLLYWVLALTSFSFGVFLTWYFSEPLLWFGVQHVSQTISSLVGDLTRQKALFDVSASGIFLSLLMLLVGLLATLLLSEGTGRLAHLLTYAVEVLFANLIFIAVLQPLYGWLQNVVSIPRFQIMDLPVLLFFLEIIPLAFFLRQSEFIKTPLKIFPLSFKRALAVSVFALGMLLMLYHSGALTHLETTEPGHRKNILIFDEGVLDWNKPMFGYYGMASAGMFGMLPSYLESMGYNVQMDSVLTGASLDNADVVMVINLNKIMPRQEKSELERFVHRGGSLLVIGDHTGFEGIMRPLNDLLRFVNIRYRFDCGHWLVDDWRDAFEFPARPLFSCVKDENDIAISIGASLDFTPSNTTPVLFAKYGFSDRGNPLNFQNANLGNRKYDPGEMLGDIVLVAKTSYGKGKVLVFGDTSSFQNDALIYSFRFVRNVFDWLTTKDFVAGIITRILSDLLLVVGMILLFTIGDGLREPRSIVASILAVSLVWVILAPKGSPEFKLANPKSPVAYIDASHLNDFAQYEDPAIWPLTHNLIRNSYLPFVCRKFSPALLKQSEMAFFVAPTASLSTKQMNEIDAYMRNGGIVVWSVGEETSDASTAMLSRVGLGLNNIPLGPVSDNVAAADFSLPPVKISFRNAVSRREISMVDSSGIRPEFHSAWPIVSTGTQRMDTLCTGWSYPVIVSEAVGQGKFVLISDSDFLLSGNLESKTLKPYGQTVLGSDVMFLHGLLRRIARKYP